MLIAGGDGSDHLTQLDRLLKRLPASGGVMELTLTLKRGLAMTIKSAKMCLYLLKSSEDLNLICLLPRLYLDTLKSMERAS